MSRARLKCRIGLTQLLAARVSSRTVISAHAECPFKQASQAAFSPRKTKRERERERERRGQERDSTRAYDFESGTHGTILSRSSPFAEAKRLSSLPSEEGGHNKDPTKGRAENVEALIYMRFRGRPHSHEKPRHPTRRVRASRKGLISMQLFRGCSRRAGPGFSFRNAADVRLRC